MKTIKMEQRYGRQNSVHVSPTVLVNGLLAADVSSSWTQQQWLDFLKPLLSAPAK